MPNLQYIGARYVPIVFDNPDDHSANWKSGVSYENLVIVTYLDDSYTSRKPVPSSVGNPADNPSYWAKTGDFNAALTNLQNEITDLNNAVGTSIPLNTYAQTTNGAINELKRIKSLSNVILISDSYGGWCQHVQHYLSLDSNHARINYQGGCGFRVDPEPGSDNGFLRLLTEVVSAMNADAKNNVSDVIIAGGYNDKATFPDSSVVSAINSGIVAVKNYVASNLPNAKLHIAFIGYTKNTTTYPKLLFANYCYRDTCMANAISYLECAKYGMVSVIGESVESDNVHPTSHGQSRIAQLIIQEIKDGYGSLDSVLYMTPMTWTFTDGSTASFDICIQTFRNRLSVYFPATRGVNLNIAITEAGRSVKIGTATLPQYIYFNEPHAIHASDLAIINTRHGTDLVLKFHENVVDYYILTKEAGTLSIAQIPPFNLEVDAYNK